MGEGATQGAQEEQAATQPRSGKRGAIALVVLFALTFVVFYVFNPGGGGGGGNSSNNATLLATQPREIAAYYAVPKGATDDPNAVLAIQNDLREVQDWLASQTDGKVLRFKETEDGAVDTLEGDLARPVVPVGGAEGDGGEGDRGRLGHRPGE